MASLDTKFSVKNEDSKSSEKSLTKRKIEQDAWKKEGGYTQAKITKLIAKYDRDKKSTTILKSNIFAGIAIFINGYTEPSFDILREVMIDHGGRFEHYYSATRVTHIIANNLALSKRKEFQHKRVIKPSWITDSVKNGVLEPCEKYELYKPASIQSYFKQSRGNKSELYTDDMELSSRDDESDLPYQFDDISENVTFKSNIPTPYNIINEPSTSKQRESSITPAAVQQTPNKSEKQDTSEMLPADHPEFISDYYRNSRLHHLSHWRMEFKQRVSEMRANPDHTFACKDLLLNTRASNNNSQNSTQPSDSKTYAHLDMDCFFVSVALKNHPELRGKPLVVTHAKSADHEGGSMADIASCSYEARKFDVKNGMWLGRAKQLCPELLITPYDFDGYNQVSELLYTIVASYTLLIEAVSCDELYINLTDLMSETGLTAVELCSHMRDNILKNTGCPVSAGIGPNLMLARLATRHGKPDGQYQVMSEQITEFISKQPVKDLPGVGRQMVKRLTELDITTCADLQKLKLVTLRHEFGQKTGEQLYNWCRGIDERKLQPDQTRTSVSCDINYGIRFNQQTQVERLFSNICKEVCNKLNRLKLRTSLVSLKLKIRHPDAPATSAKYMGHGIVNNVTKSQSLSATGDENAIYNVCINMWKKQNIPARDLRGVGIQLSKLISTTGVNSTGNKTLFSYNLTNKTSSHRTNIAENSTSAGKIAENRLEPAHIYVISDTESERLSQQNFDNTVPQTRPFLAGRANTNEVRALIQQWINSTGAPLQTDINKVTDYLLKLIKFGDLTAVKKICTHLYYGALRRDGIWTEIYTNLQHEVDKLVTHLYNSSLKLYDVE